MRPFRTLMGKAQLLERVRHAGSADEGGVKDRIGVDSLELSSGVLHLLYPPPTASSRPQKKRGRSLAFGNGLEGRLESVLPAGAHVLGLHGEGAFTDSIAQVVELRAADVALALDFDLFHAARRLRRS
jgi:hypothetical protein